MTFSDENFFSLRKRKPTREFVDIDELEPKKIVVDLEDDEVLPDTNIFAEDEEDLPQLPFFKTIEEIRKMNTQQARDLILLMNKRHSFYSVAHDYNRCSLPDCHARISKPSGR